MKSLKLIVGLAAFGAVAAAYSQTAIGPFFSPLQERFDTTPVNTYVAFPGFFSLASVQRIGTNGLLVVHNNPAFAPSISAPNNMWGRGVDVQIKMLFGTWNRFGGGFRMVNAGLFIPSVTFRFLRNGNPVGVPVTTPINNLNWVWSGWNLASLGGFDEIHITGNGPIPGYVAMDNLRIWL